MNKHSFLTLAAVTLLSFTFSSCEKEPPAEPVNERSAIVIGLGKRLIDCNTSYFFCIPLQDVFGKDIPTLSLGTDEFVSEPVVNAAGAIELAMSVDTNRLSPRTRTLLLEQRQLTLEDDIVLNEGVMRQAYENAGLPYNGQQAEVLKGTYDITTVGNGGPVPQRIIITITIKDGKVTISIKW
ncbi:MAG: hypothetical protein KF852_12575 [Saprospiraceae bacterium]|nr:hypothetical protein [Saprospiraceae bacterium]